MSKITVKQYGRLLYELVASVKNELELKKLITAFGELLIQKGQTGRLEEIIRSFGEYGQQKAGEVNVHVITSRKIESKQVAVIEKTLSGMLGKKIKLNLAVDKSILGGIIWQSDGQFFDGSLRGKLNNLEKQMIR